MTEAPPASLNRRTTLSSLQQERWLKKLADMRRIKPQASPPMRRPISHGKYLGVLAGLFLTLWIGLAIHPWYRSDWAMENALVVLLIIGLAVFRRWLFFSRLSYTLIFLFLCLHQIGAHYTYAKVPYDTWWRAVTGGTLNSLLGWERNNFDRVVHFMYGFLLAYPIREIFLRVANVRGFWGYFLPLDLTLSTSALFELVEWGVAEVFGGDLGAAYLGAQGDIWDAHKDMALAGLGALIAMLVTALINSRMQRDFAREWAKSLRVKNHEPLGEDAILERQRHNPSRPKH
jgi:putative membrane protein